MAASKDMHGFFNFQLETCGSRIEDFKTVFWTPGATIFKTSQVLKDVGMFVRGEMFTDAKILSLRVYDRESFTSFHVQAVMPVSYIGETNRHFATRIREHLASDKHIPTSLSTWEVWKLSLPGVQKIVLKSSTLLPHVSNWKLKKPCISFGSSHL